MIDDQDVGRETDGAQKDIKIAFCNREILSDAQAVEARHRQRYADQQCPGRLLFHENAHNGHDDNVQRRDEAGLAAGGGLQALLLEVGRHSQGHAAAGPAHRQVLPGLRGTLHNALLHPAAHHAQHQQKQKGDGRPGGVEGERLHIVGAHALGHKGCAPDQGGQHRQHILPDTIDLHFPCSYICSVVYCEKRHSKVVF